jgi:hypothetical protein
MQVTLCIFPVDCNITVPWFPHNQPDKIQGIFQNLSRTPKYNFPRPFVIVLGNIHKMFNIVCRAKKVKYFSAVDA